MTWFLVGLAIILVCAPFAVAAVSYTKRHRGGAIVVMGMLMMFGMNMQITPPPPPHTELIQREAEDDQSEE